MLKLFCDAYNSYPSRRSDFKAEPMLNFTPKDLFTSVRASLSSSIQSFMKSITPPDVHTVVAVPVASLQSQPSVDTALDWLLNKVSQPTQYSPRMDSPKDELAERNRILEERVRALERARAPGGGCCALM
jgi:hypothetical protein